MSGPGLVKIIFSNQKISFLNLMRRGWPLNPCKFKFKEFILIQLFCAWLTSSTATRNIWSFYSKLSLHLLHQCLNANQFTTLVYKTKNCWNVNTQTTTLASSL